MPFLKKQWLVIRNFLDELPRDTKLLIVTLALFLGLLGFVMLQYAASSEKVPLRQVAPDRQEMVLSRLASNGIKTEMHGGMIMVPQEQQTHALAVLAQGELLAPDTSAAFDQMIARQSPWNSDRQNQQMYLIAKQKVLAQVISKMVGVRSADVMLSTPENSGFGSKNVRPTASVNVVMQGSARVNRRQVGAIAGLVSGAVAEMRPQDVVVIDANNGIQHTGKSDQDVGIDESLELVQAQEHRYREKIERALSYIPGVIVAVNVLTDSMISEQKETFQYSQNEPLRSDRSREEERTNAERAGEPGAQPNTSATIEGGSGSTTTERITETETNYAEKPLTVRAQSRYIGRTTKEINVTVNVPRPYFVSMYMQGQPADADTTEEPNDTALKPVVEEELRKIESQVEPIIKAEGVSVVRAHMIPDPRQMLAIFGPKSEQAGVLMMVQQDWFKNLSVVALAILSLGIMFFMVRKANQKPQLPSVEELAGVPPTLPSDDDIVGEVDQEMGAMAGVEVDEDEIRSRQIADQISEMVKGSPAEAANLVGRWLRTEE